MAKPVGAGWGMKRGFLIVALSMFVSGVLIRHYELPPYSWVRDVKTAVSPKHRAPQYLARMSLFTSSIGEADIVMLGDSITQFGEWSELFPRSKIINRGIDGDTADGVLARLDEVIARKPRIVFLMIGINDLFLGIKPQIIERNVRSIAASLNANGAHVVLQSTLPVKENVKINSQVQELNALLRKVPEVTFVELHPALAPSGALLSDHTWDGVHLSGPAYMIWRDAIASKIDGVNDGLR